MSKKPVRTGIVGYPVDHSRSPNIHGYWLKKHGISGSYDRYLVAPEVLAGFLGSLDEQGLSGCNITIPHKETALSCCALLTDRARSLGAVNTLWLENGILHGDNTDAGGFIANLGQNVPDWQKRARTAVVLGAGGSARAIVYGLAEAGIRSIIVVNRNPVRAEDLVTTLAPGVSRFGAILATAPWEARDSLLAHADLLVNTTSLGMKGQPALEINLAGLPRGAIVADIVYVPLTTGLLARAKKHGFDTSEGLGMLLHQAAPGFEKWFGQMPQVTPELRALVESDIPKS